MKQDIASVLSTNREDQKMEPWTDNDDSSQESIMPQDDFITSNIDVNKPMKVGQTATRLNSDLNVVKSPRRI